VAVVGPELSGTIKRCDRGLSSTLGEEVKETSMLNAETIDNISCGEQEIQETHEWEQEMGKRKPNKKRAHLQATRQSSRLKHHGVQQ
jgi:hypothetical protein